MPFISWNLKSYWMNKNLKLKAIVSKWALKTFALKKWSTVKHRFTGTRIRTPHYYGQFALSLGKESLSFPLNSTWYLWTPINIDTFYRLPQCPYWRGLTVKCLVGDQTGWGYWLSLSGGCRKAAASTEGNWSEASFYLFYNTPQWLVFPRHSTGPEIFLTKFEINNYIILELEMLRKRTRKFTIN